MKKIKNLYKKLPQWGVLGGILFLVIRKLVDKGFEVDFEAYCPFGGFQALVSFIKTGNLACSMTSTQIFMGIIFLIGVIFFGKLFCSYLCPLGTISENLGKIGDKLGIRKNIDGLYDKILRSLKYVLLFVTVHYTTASNELFCKHYDPFFAGVSFFGDDVVVWAAISSILVLVAGAILVKMFWCKYLCPLNALFNVFRFSLIIIGMTLVYAITIFLNLDIPFYWFLGSLCLIGYIAELSTRKCKHLPMLKITRDEHKCINCGLCSKKCPQGIDVANLKVVDKADCNLCGECVACCPVENTLTINKKNNIKWLPISITVLLVVIGLIISEQVKIPTITEVWGDEAAIENAGIYQQDDIRKIECFGSSKSFISQMKKLDGVLGVATYVKTHTAKIWYDKSKLNEEKIRKAIFSPVRVFVDEPSDDNEKLAVVRIAVNNFFDSYDAMFLEKLFANFGGIYSFESMFGEPVEIDVYCSADIKLEELKKCVETKRLKFSSGGVDYNEKLNFKVKRISSTDKTISGLELKKRLFPSFKRAFNNRSKYKKDEYTYLEVKLLDYPRGKQMMPYLINYIGKADKGIIGVVSGYNDYPFARFYYVKELTTEEHVWKLISNNILNITYSNGQKERMKNPYKFKKLSE